MDFKCVSICELVAFRIVHLFLSVAFNLWPSERAGKSFDLFMGKNNFQVSFIVFRLVRIKAFGSFVISSAHISGHAPDSELFAQLSVAISQLLGTT